MSSAVNRRRMIIMLLCCHLFMVRVWGIARIDANPQQGKPPADPRNPSSRTAPPTQEADNPAGPNGEVLQDIRKLLDEGYYAQAESGARTLLARVEGQNGRDSLDSAKVLDLLVEALSEAR